MIIIITNLSDNNYIDENNREFTQSDYGKLKKQKNEDKRKYDIINRENKRKFVALRHPDLGNNKMKIYIKRLTNLFKLIDYNLLKIIITI